MSDPSNEPDMKQGIGFGDRRANIIGLVCLGLMVLGFLVGVVFVVLMIVKQSDAEEKTKSGILLPDSAKEKPTKGKVIAVGAGKMTEDGKRLAPEVKAGDRILFGKYSGSEVKVDDKEYLILREDDILAVLG